MIMSKFDGWSSAAIRCYIDQPRVFGSYDCVKV